MLPNIIIKIKNCKFTFQLRSRQADEYRSLEEDYRQRHQRLHEAHEQEIQNCIRRYFAKNNQEQPEDLSLHRGGSGIGLTPLPSAPDSAQSSQFGSPPLLGREQVHNELKREKNPISNVCLGG